MINASSQTYFSLTVNDLKQGLRVLVLTRNESIRKPYALTVFTAILLGLRSWSRAFLPLFSPLSA